jgi:hypothetical protein
MQRAMRVLYLKRGANKVSLGRVEKGESGHEGKRREQVMREIEETTDGG